MTRRVKLPDPREAEIQRSGMAWLRAQGCQVYRRNTGGMYDAVGNFVRFSEPGAADTWGITPAGHHIEVEWKRPGNRPTLVQVSWLMKTNGHGRSASWWVDNIDTLERVYWWVTVHGGRVVFSDETRVYREEGKTVQGPSGDYDLY